MTNKKVICKYGYDHAENSTSVIAIKYKDRQEYIRFDKKQNIYSWVKRKKGYYMLPEKAERVKENSYQEEMMELYLEKEES